MNIYEYAKQTYESITPLRGKRASQDIRPLGKRTRWWERIRKVGDSYAYHLYSTDILTINPDGTATFSINGWISNTTADFINRRVPCLYACRRYNLMWIGRSLNTQYIPVNTTAVLNFNFNSEKQRWDLLTKVTMFKRQIDKEKSKEVRKLGEEFIEFAEIMLPIISWDEDINTWTSISPEVMDRGLWAEKLMQLVQREWDWEARGYRRYAPSLEHVRKVVNAELYARYKPYKYIEVALTDSAQDVSRVEYN